MTLEIAIIYWVNLISIHIYSSNCFTDKNEILIVILNKENIQLQLATAATVAKASTASLGKFQDKLPKEKEARGKGIKELIPGKERKRKAPIPNATVEKANNLTLLDNILSKRPKIDMEKAVSKQINEEQIE